MIVRRPGGQPKSVCIRGHVFDADNTRISPEGWKECRACDREYHARKRMSPNYVPYVRDKSKDFAYYIRYKYKLSLDDFNGMYLRQNGCCAICQKPFGANKPCVDHDHETLKVRGLLCRPCNTSIGCLGESEEILLNALRYLGYDNFTMDSDIQPLIDRLNAAVPTPQQ